MKRIAILFAVVLIMGCSIAKMPEGIPIEGARMLAVGCSLQYTMNGSGYEITRVKNGYIISKLVYGGASFVPLADF